MPVDITNLTVQNLIVSGPTAYVNHDMYVGGTLYPDIDHSSGQNVSIPDWLHVAQDISGPTAYFGVGTTLDIYGNLVSTGSTIHVNSIDTLNVGTTTYLTGFTGTNLTIGSTIYTSLLDYAGLTYIPNNFSLNDKPTTVESDLVVSPGSALTTTTLGSTTGMLQIRDPLNVTNATFTNLNNVARIVADAGGLYIEGLTGATEGGSQYWKFVLYNETTNEIGVTSTFMFI